MKKTITLKNAKEIFPDKITRITPRDFLNLRIDKEKFLTKNERNRFEEFADKGKKGLVEYSDLLVKRKNNKLFIQDF